MCLQYVKCVHSPFKALILPHNHPLTGIKTINLHLYAASDPVLNLPRSEHASHMQMFHLQTTEFISHYHGSLQTGGDRD